MSADREGMLDVVLRRTSPARLGVPGPDDASLELILAAGLRAPDHGSLRPWRFLVVRGEARSRFGELLAASLAARNPGATEASLEAERAKALRAPVLIVVAATPRDTDRIPEIEQIVSAGAAAQNMMLAAHALGHGAFWRTGPVAYDKAFKSGLGLREIDRIVALLYLGTIHAAGKAKHPEPGGVIQMWTGALPG
jgi:nitroreductase